MYGSNTPPRVVKYLQSNGVASGTNDYLRQVWPEISCDGSQDGEAAIIEKLLPGVGTYIDVGANGPVQFSNTWALYKRGWRGLLIEPLLSVIPSLARQRPGDFVYPVAVLDYDGLTTLRVSGPVSSVRPEWAIKEQCRVAVECQTLDSILSRFPTSIAECRFCSIDVEGSEREVLLGIDWNRFHPEVLCIEYRDYDAKVLGADISKPWIGIVTNEGYREVHRTRWNIIFQRT